MSILVNHCYHWVSYHLIDAFLMAGHSVVGIHDKISELDEHLSMFLGRNSSFIEGIPKKKLTDFELAIVFGNDKSISKIKANKIIRITADQRSTEKNVTIIQEPLLFGKWMPMNKNGMFHNGQFISFQSDYFNEQAIYIGDFSKLLLSWFTKTFLPSNLNVHYANFRGNKDVLLENSIYIHDNVPIIEKLNQVLKHYRQFKDLYPQQ